MTINYAQARENMVEQQVRPWEVLDRRVLSVIGRMPREAFVDPAHRELAYSDLSLPLGHDQFMMKPVVEGRTLQALLPEAYETVLEIGTGSGYLTACLAALAKSVHSLEIQPALAENARTRLAGQGSANATVETADAMQWSTQQRFDVVCVTGAVAEIPAHFRDWLVPRGRMFVIHGESPVMEATVVHADVNARPAESLFETDIPYLLGAAPAPRFVL
ncbi:protein-L-isoaspartate O-methyltransferase [Lysobacter pythonis]|uniref:Protein-L-isoaspartate O-methyltransferase n=1 Tax=Solilutibacter pythonis TaxID=2483112 RepID=A0A3M2HTQ3_9GAMM|nr:protein-L-isoaspartate O-methyltransferase [Lysobacter pythonis]RMH93111.1 protein-L-isoaspartate O-methyltransferase [Lysobacter pythonis]